MNKRSITNSLHKLLKEEEHFLFEKWSHYEDLDNAVNYIYNEIAKVLPYIKSKPVIENQIYYRDGETKISVFGLEMNLIFRFYIATNNAFINTMVRHCYSKNGISDDEKTMTLTIYSVNGSLLEPLSNKTVSHELKHVLQISLGMNNNVNYNSLGDLAFEHASDVLDNPASNDTEINIATLYYYSNEHEQDSFMEEYYKDLCDMKQAIWNKNSETHALLNHYKDLMDWYYNNKNKPETISVVSSYRIHGMPKRNFETMINNGYKRFIRKMNNIEKNFNNTTEYLNEHKQRNGINPRTGSTIRFKL